MKLKERIALYVMKKSIRKQEPTEKNQGLIASLLGISSLAFLFLAILFAVSFVSTGLAPLILTGVGSLTTSILGSIKAKKVLRKTPENGEEGQRKLAVLGMITSSITIAAILIMVLIGGCVLSI